MHSGSTLPGGSSEGPILSASGRPLGPHWLAVIVTIWLGQAASMVTSFSASFAAVWYMTEATGSALMLAAMSICAYLPTGLLSPFGGVVADRFNRKAVLIVADFSVGLVSLAMGFVILAGSLSPALIFVLVVVRSVGQAFHSPAMMATMPMLVPERHLLRINTLDQMLMALVNVGAPALGIMIYTGLGFQAAMFLDFFGALVACAALLPAKVPNTWDAQRARAQEGEGPTVLGDIKVGWDALASNRGLLTFVGLLTLVMVAYAPIGSLYPLMTYNHFGGDGYMAAVVEAVFAVGMIVGSVTLMVWGGGRRLALLVCVMSAAFGVICFAAGLLPPTAFPVFVGLCGAMGFAVAWLNGPYMTLVQNNVAEDKLGRVLGFTTMAMGLASPIGIAIGGAVAEVTGIAPFFVADGLLCALLGLLVYAPRTVRALDNRPAQGSVR